MSWVRYQYYWTIYPETKLVVTSQSLARRANAITTTYKVLGMTPNEINAMSSRTEADVFLIALGNLIYPAFCNFEFETINL